MNNEIQARIDKIVAKHLKTLNKSKRNNRKFKKHPKKILRSSDIYPKILNSTSEWMIEQILNNNELPKRKTTIAKTIRQECGYFNE